MIGKLPAGNFGRATVSALRPMPLDTRPISTFGCFEIKKPGYRQHNS